MREFNLMTEPLNYREGRSGIIGRSQINWGPIKKSDDLYFQWHNSKIDLIASPELGDFGLNDDIYDEYTLFKEGSDGSGYFLQFDIPIETLQSVRKEEAHQLYGASVWTERDEE